MMLMLLLTELIRLDVHLSAGPDGLRVQAPSGALTDELHQAMTEHKAALLRYATYPYIETMDGLGTLTGARREQDAIFFRSQHWERLRYTIGVKLLPDGIERFYLPGTVWEVASMGEKECPASDPPSPPLPAESIPGVKRTRPLLCDQ